jgi:hypothetical protein
VRERWGLVAGSNPAQRPLLEALSRGLAPNKPTRLNVSRLTGLGRGPHAQRPGLTRIGPSSLLGATGREETVTGLK